MLTITCKVGEVIEIGEIAAFRVQEKSGSEVRLAFAAPKSVRIRRIATGIIKPKYITGIIDKEARRFRDEVKNNSPIAAAI